MFQWLTKLVDDARIAFAYLGYERECKEQWVADAERTYSTAQIEHDVKTLMTAPLHRVSTEFDVPVRDLETKRQGVDRVVTDDREKLAILERDYKSQLDAAYKTLNETREEFDACRQNLSKAHDDLSSAKRSLDSWYSRAEGNWFGNGGKQLPKHSFFGQDLSDRDRYKSSRDSAAHDVGRCKSERPRIKRQLDDARAIVQQIKEDARQVMFDLKKAGFDKRFVKSAISNGNADLRSIGEEIARLAKSRKDYIHQAKASLGVYALEVEISRLRQECAARVKAFDSKAMVAERKGNHRAEWLSERGK